MLAIAVLFFLSVGFAVYGFLIYLPICWAKKRGFSKRKRRYVGMASFLIVSTLFFGKNLISYGAFRYYCRTEAGMNIYKPLEQWKAENPSVWETLKKVNSGSDYQDKTQYPDVPYERTFNGKEYRAWGGGNQRTILYSNTEYTFWSALEIRSFILIDNQTQEILADYHYFHWTNTWDTSPGYNGRRGISYLGEDSCKPEEREFFDYKMSFSNPSLTPEEK